MRKLFLALSVLALIGALFLVGCGGDGATENGTADDPAATQPAEGENGAGDDDAGDDGAAAGGGIPKQPSGHTGWWANGGETMDACISCHVPAGGGGGTDMPEGHISNGAVDSTFEGCISCHPETT